MRGALLPVLLVLVLGGGGTIEPVGASSAASDLPNLAPLAAHDLQVGTTDEGQGRALRFAVTTVNMGEHPFDILPQEIDASTARAHQCLRWAAPRACLERGEVGELMWHPGHEHFHLRDFAAFELRRVDEHAEPIPGPEGLTTASRKLGFCLAELAQHRDAGPFYRAPYYVSCAGGLGYQGLSPGWQDTYSATRSGQQLPLEGVADGIYAVLVTIDPDGKLHETTREDNTSVQLIELHGDAVQPIIP